VDTHGPTVELRTTAIAKGGDAIAREPSGRVVFVAGALAGELVAVELSHERSDFARGRTVHVIEPSPDRVEPPCPAVAAGCGGCDVQHAAPAAQLALKQAIVANALGRIGRLHDIPPIDTVALPVEGYRTTVRGLVVDGRFALHRRHSHAAVSIDSCLVLHPLLDELVQEGRFGAATAVTLRCGARTGERIAIIEPNTAGVVLPPDVRVASTNELRHGRRVWFHEVVDGRTFRISAQSFFQARPDGAEALLAAVRTATGMIERQHQVVDAYSGVGLFAATVLRNAAVEVIERDASSVADARHNLRGVDAKIVRADVQRWRPSPADFVIADPSRDGLGRVAAERLAATGASRLVLVSCDPAAFARDTALLDQLGYTLSAATIVDLFGHTSHIEVVSRFDLRPRPDPGSSGRGA
jgi:23S rRNA (uracil1939-C5)-methyltransferase